MLRDQAELASGLCRTLTADPDALKMTAAAHQRLVAAGDDRRLLEAGVWFGWAAKDAERFEEAEFALGQLALVAERYSEPILLFQALWHLADCLWRQGRLTEAEDLLKRGQDASELLPMSRPFHGSLAAYVLLDGGRLDQASELLSAMDGTDRETCSQMWTGLARGTLLSRQGHVDSAVDTFRRVRQLAEATGHGEPCSIPWAAEAIRAAAAAGAADDVAAIVAWLEPPAVTLTCGWPRGVLAFGQAVIAELAGCLDKSEAFHADSVEMFRLGGRPLAYAGALIEQGAFQRRHGRSHAARRPLAAALGLAESRGAGWYAERAKRELAQAGGRPSRNRGILTVQEATIARLAAAGLTNHSIATQLYLSVKTIETHLSHVYSKLGINTRRHLQQHQQLFAGETR
jgi:DNA-binding CsgD family transcriptional regulator